MSDTIHFEIPARAEYISTVRLLTSGLMANLKLNIEEIDDMKMSVAEACNIAIKLEPESRINIEYRLDSDVEIFIKGKGIDKAKIEDDRELSMSSLIIRTLADEVSYCDGGMLIKKVLK